MNSIFSVGTPGATPNALLEWVLDRFQGMANRMISATRRRILRMEVEPLIEAYLQGGSLFGKI